MLQSFSVIYKKGLRSACYPANRRKCFAVFAFTCQMRGIEAARRKYAQRDSEENQQQISKQQKFS
jgi:hypothetical protein